MKNTWRICPQTDSPENSKTETGEMWNISRPFQSCIRREPGATQHPSMLHHEGLDTARTLRSPPTTGRPTDTSVGCTLLDVGDPAFGLLAPGFFFLILIPGTGAEFRASRKPVDSIAAARQADSWRHGVGFRSNVC